MCNAAWKEDYMSGQEQFGVSRNQPNVGAKHTALGWSHCGWKRGFTICMLMGQSGRHSEGLLGSLTRGAM